MVKEDGRSLYVNVSEVAGKLRNESSIPTHISSRIAGFSFDFSKVAWRVHSVRNVGHREDSTLAP